MPRARWPGPRWPSPPGPVPGQRREHRAVAARSAAGAHGRHRRSWHVGHRPNPAGPRRAGLRVRRQGVARCACAAGAGRVDPDRTRRVVAGPVARWRHGGRHYPCRHPQTNPELVEARRRGIPVVLRPAVLAKLMAGRTTLMVTGTHGKTTTTSMLIVALQHCGLDPSFAVGGELGRPVPTPITAVATVSSPKPTKAMARCCSTHPTSR